MQKHSGGSAPVLPLAQTHARLQACPKQHARPMQSHTACPLVPGASVIPLAGMNSYLHACRAHDMQTPQKNGRSHGIAVKLCCYHCASCAHAHGHLCGQLRAYELLSTVGVHDIEHQNRCIGSTDTSTIMSCYDIMHIRSVIR